MGTISDLNSCLCHKESKYYLITELQQQLLRGGSSELLLLFSFGEVEIR